MTLLKIAPMGNPVLIKQAEAVPDPSIPAIKILIKNMVETMEDAVGVGLAAPQVYQGKRIIIFKSPRERGEEIGVETDFSPLTALINPEFKPVEKEKDIGWEGCLSIPGLSGLVPRYRHIRYHGYLPSGERIEREATNFHARVVQHEIDHLDGILFPMRMNDLSLLSFNEELPNFNNHINSTIRENGTI
tara:strand:+ start:713 stop:1279 length:567 start_codon:yes stop_codon:yes gene_type:complete